MNRNKRRLPEVSPRRSHRPRPLELIYMHIIYVYINARITHIYVLFSRLSPTHTPTPVLYLPTPTIYMYMLPTAITTGSPFRGKMCYIGSSLRVYTGESPPQLVRVFDAQYLSVHKLKETKHRDHVNLHTCDCTLINCNSILRVIIHNTYYRHFIRLRDYAVNARTQIPRLHQFDFRSRIVIILPCRSVHHRDVLYKSCASGRN